MAGCNIIFLIKEIRGPAVSPDESLNVYRAVKKQPFFIIISSSFPQVDFHTAKVTASLRYQTDTPPGKDVMFIKANPLEFSTKVVEIQSEKTENNNVSHSANNSNDSASTNNSHNTNHNNPENTFNNNSNGFHNNSSSAYNNNNTNLNTSNYNSNPCYNNSPLNSVLYINNPNNNYNYSESIIGSNISTNSHNSNDMYNNPSTNYNSNLITSGNSNNYPNNNYRNNNPNSSNNKKSAGKEGSSNKKLELEVETKILTLSSQHQGSYFYIHFQLKLVNFGQEIYCELDTPPIQVISKKGSNHTPIQRRKPASDIITAALNRIEESEYQKTDWLSQLCTNNTALRENAWWQGGNDISSLLARMCYSFRNVPNPQRTLAIAMELSQLGYFEKNVIDYIVANLRIN